MQAQGSRALALTGAGALFSSLGGNALAVWLLPAAGWWLTGGLGLSLAENTGISFGLGAQNHPGLVTAVVTIALIVAAFALRKGSKIGLGLLIGGGLANLIDRLGDGRVTDYIAIGPWPAFNVADACITIGAILILTHLLRRR
jgi:signal peptidase II